MALWQTLRIRRIGEVELRRIRRHKPAHFGTIMARPEVVEPRFGILFFTGNLYTNARTWGVVVDELVCIVVVGYPSFRGWLVPVNFRANQDRILAIRNHWTKDSSIVPSSRYPLNEIPANRTPPARFG
jgi:hypothetical protein